MSGKVFRKGKQFLLFKLSVSISVLIRDIWTLKDHIRFIIKTFYVDSFISKKDRLVTNLDLSKFIRNPKEIQFPLQKILKEIYIKLTFKEFLGHIKRFE